MQRERLRDRMKKIQQAVELKLKLKCRSDKIKWKSTVNFRPHSHDFIDENRSEKGRKKKERE